MVKCPMCSKQVPETEPRCPFCQADLSLIAAYVKDLQTGLVLAEQHTRAGRLGEAVWTYLEVLEIDPDNAVARKQVGRVATAVRQFDHAAPSRRWARGLQRQSRLRRWLQSIDDDGGYAWLMWLFLILMALLFGYFLGQYSEHRPTPGNGTARAPVQGAIST